MEEYRLRLAKPSDAKEIAAVQWHVRDRYTRGFSLSLSKKFLVAFYKIVLNDPWEVVVCAVNEEGKIVGFSSATTNARARYNNIRKHRLSLGLAALKGLICHPSLLKGLWQRYRSLKEDGKGPKFVTMDGVRGGYWCWLKSEDSLFSVDLDHAKGHILYDLGCRECFFEVDKENKQVFKYHLKVNKAEPIEEITLPDGRQRVLFKSILKPSK